MNDTSKLTEQTADRTQWRYPSLWSANRTNHIANLEKEVATLQFKLSEITTQLTQVHKERDEAVAEAAAYREALVENFSLGFVERSLGRQPGKAFLDRMKELEAIAAIKACGVTP